MGGDDGGNRDRRVERDQRSPVLLAETEKVDVGDLAGPSNSLRSEQRAVTQRDTVWPKTVRRPMRLAHVIQVGHRRRRSADVIRQGGLGKDADKAVFSQR